MDIPHIQWFPGHMTKTKRKMQEDIKLVDVVIELLDARIPNASKNPLIKEIIGDKPHILVLNKADLSDQELNIMWKKHYEGLGYTVLILSLSHTDAVTKLNQGLNKLLHDEIARWREKGMVGKKIRAMIVGVTNVGKSSLINKLAGGKKAKVEDRPGVTRARQWYSAGKDLEILDTPGVLWPKFENPEVGEKLAFTGAIKDDVIDVELVAMRLIRYYLDRSKYKDMLMTRYNLKALSSELFDSLNEYEVLEVIGKNRGMLLSKNEIDTIRAANMLLDEFRSGKLGKVTLESPDDFLKK